MLQAQHLHFRGILQGVDLTLEPGQWLALVGANGSGKSTLLKVLAGLLPTESGEVRRQGGVGWLMQNPESQLVCNTVEEEVAFGPGQMGLPRSQLLERVEWALQQVKLWSRRHWQIHQLSAGQKQRLALAAVLALRPRTLLLDEPTSMLDTQARSQLLQLMASLREDLGILWVTHSSQELAQADQVLLLEHGTIARRSTPAQLWAEPHLFQDFGLDIPSDLQLESLPSRPWSGMTSGPTWASPSWATLARLEYRYPLAQKAQGPALQDLTCQLPQGAATALVGETGSGKSTLLLHLNLLLRPQKGSLVLLGQEIAPQQPARPWRQKVGLLFQQPERQFFLDSVWDEVRYGPHNFGLPAESLGRSALEQVGLPFETFAQRNPFRLSGGEQRLLALACVLACQPQALALDEPTAGLDRAHRHQLWALLGQLQTQGQSQALISHDLEEVGQLCRHLIWLDQGQCRAQGCPQLLFSQLAEAGWEIPPWSSGHLLAFPDCPRLPVNRQQFQEWLQQIQD